MCDSQPDVTLTAGISVLSHDPSVAAQGVDAQPLSHEVAETGRVQIAATANNAVFGEATDLPGHIGQNIHWEENRGTTSATHEQVDNEGGTFRSSVSILSACYSAWNRAQSSAHGRHCNAIT